MPEVGGREGDGVGGAVERGVDAQVVPTELQLPGGGVRGVAEEGDVVLAEGRLGPEAVVEREAVAADDAGHVA